ncbi:RHS repeat-associated core domain-containing protein [Nonomuraea aridisoli]|uniref:RHS repeat-associated core domain-containing protein n=1 Tax=Nonomuraea aridisoli TaxID=2070368 RepID=UPI0015E8D640|nr:RHS repeat-associated core domain-containing protein [Nonomuraea aridisoli]
MFTALAVAVGVLVAPPASAEPEGTDRPEVKSMEKVVQGRSLNVTPRRADPAETSKSWPEPGPATVRASAHARVEIMTDTQAARVGVEGVLFALTTEGKTEIEVDYSKLATAYGGSFGSRLRLVKLPTCAIGTPDELACRAATPVPARNDTERGTLTAELPAAAVAEPGATILAAVAGESSDKGDYAASKLSPSATWDVSLQSGAFTWNYPMRVPQVPGSLEPKVGLSYSSSSVDGRTSNTNNQPSWVGEGFDFWPGSINRSYKPCSDDGAPKDEYGTPPGDHCWAYDNATISWNGRGGELVQAGDGTWRIKNDDGTRVERLRDTAKANGDNDGEYWKVTDTSGVQFFFGLNRLPGWASGKPETRSVWTQPVFGDDSGEPCHGSSFASSWCQQGYQWNLDYVVDPRGNAVTYFYTQESNHYGRNLKPADETPYVRGGWLNRIEYGQRSNTLFTTKAPAKVLFGVSERCVPTDDFDCAPDKIDSAPNRWPDVPYDLNCAEGTECKGTKGTVAPSFWSRKRLTKVTTQVIKADGNYRDVESWAIDHLWGQADIDQALLVKSIKHSGLAATPAVTLPSVTFNHVQLPNRLDREGDDIAPFVKYRIGAIYDESGGQIEVGYSGADCTLTGLPTPETNTRRCFPVKWTPAGHADPITDWFHKYVVTQMVRLDRTGRAPDQVSSYEYLGGAAWHFDDDDGLTKEKYKTWSQWRGYGHVRVRTGGQGSPLSQTDHHYLRGMDGDRLNPAGGEKRVTVSDGEGGSHVDHDALAGFELKTVEFDQAGGTAEEKVVKTPWRHQTASRTRSWGTVTANMVDVGQTRTLTLVEGGSWRQTKLVNTYETTAGLKTQVDDLGDVAIGTDDLCTRTTYAKNAAAHLLSLPSRVETVAVSCATTPDRSRHVVKDQRSYYDGGALGAVPSKGLITKIEEIAAHDGTTARYTTTSTTTYDSYGRQLTVTDALGQVSTTAYTDTAGLTSQVKRTTPPAVKGDVTTAHTSTEVFDPAIGMATVKIDAGGKRTDLAYDALGRLIKVWLPDRSQQAGQTPSYEFGYHIADGRMVAVSTRELTAEGGQTAPTYELYDGFLRLRQTQEPGPDGGRLISDKLYDSRGNVAREYAQYYATGTPSTTLFGAYEGNVETQKAFEYDGRGRRTVEKLLVGNGDTQEKWRIVTTYGGDRVSVDPPAGDTPATTLTDARGRVVETRSHHGDAPTGAYDKTTYTYTPRGQLATVKDPAGNTWTHTYDLRGREIRNVDPDKGTTENTYDDLGRLTSVRDGRGRTAAFVYDGLGRKTETREGSVTGPLLASWTYDTVVKGMPSGSSRFVNGNAYASTINAYDDLNRAIRTTVTIPVSEGGLAGDYVFDTRYKLDGTLQSTGYPAAGGLPAEVVVHGYDALERPTTTSSNLSTYVTRSIHSFTGKPEQYELSTGAKKTWLTNFYEYGTQRLASSRVDREDVAGVDRAATYTYDPAGNITQISDISRSGTDTQCFRYDYLRRLEAAWTQGTTTCAAEPADAVIGGVAPYWQSFSYDLTGNRTREVEHGIGGAADTVRNYAYPAAGQSHPHALISVTQTGGAGNRTDEFGYDDVGNMIRRAIGDAEQTLEWDVEGRLSKVTQGTSVTSFLYDADGERLIRREATATTLYLPGMELKLSTASGTVAATRYYAHGDGTVALRRADGVRFFAGDHQGTSEIAVDAATQRLTQRRFSPFGKERGALSGTWPGEKGFVGGTLDASTGLTHLGAREYDPGLGRFISVDPVIDVKDPQQMNGYAYSGNNPITYSDPDGALNILGAIAAAIKIASSVMGMIRSSGVSNVNSGGGSGYGGGGGGGGSSPGPTFIPGNPTVDPVKLDALTWIGIGLKVGNQATKIIQQVSAVHPHAVSAISMLRGLGAPGVGPFKSGFLRGIEATYWMQNRLNHFGTKHADKLTKAGKVLKVMSSLLTYGDYFVTQWNQDDGRSLPARLHRAHLRGAAAMGGGLAGGALGGAACAATGVGIVIAGGCAIGGSLIGSALGGMAGEKLVAGSDRVINYVKPGLRNIGSGTLNVLSDAGSGVRNVGSGLANAGGWVGDRASDFGSGVVDTGSNVIDAMTFW